MIKNIIFDLSEVIISGYWRIENLIEKKYEIPAEDFLQQKINKNELFLDLMRGNLKEEDYWNELGYYNRRFEKYSKRVLKSTSRGNNGNY